MNAFDPLPIAASPSTPATARHARAFERACALDVEVRKPGNVSIASAGHGMVAAQFVAAAAAAAPALTAPHAGVGARIEAAVRASWDAAGCNTNLGIVLLGAPLAAAAQALAAHADPPHAPTALRQTLSRTLHALTRDDAEQAFRAIAAANPGGLGHAASNDVHAAPTVDLRAAMALAASRDTIAAAYVDDFALVFDVGLPSFDAARADGTPLAGAVQRAFVALLASRVDAHVLRKHHLDRAMRLQRDARRWAARLVGEPTLDLDADDEWAAWDDRLKADRVNPGTTADFTVATLFAAELCTPGALDAASDAWRETA